MAKAMSSANAPAATDSSGDDNISPAHSPTVQMTEDAGITPMRHKSKSLRPIPTADSTNEMMIKNAGATPGPSCKARSNRLPFVHLSPFANTPRMDRVLSSTRKQKCLFNTMHVKPALALLTVFYLLGLAVLDLLLFAAGGMSENLYMLFGGLSLCFIASILVAQYGLYKESYLLIMPFLVAQSTFTVVVCAAFTEKIVSQLVFANMHPEEAMHLALLIIHEVVITLMQAYALVITFRCISYLRHKEKNRSTANYSYRSFVDMPTDKKNKKKSRSVNLQIDLTTDDETNGGISAKPMEGLPKAGDYSRASILTMGSVGQSNGNGGALQTPGEKPKRQVTFAEPVYRDVSY